MSEEFETEDGIAYCNTEEFLKGLPEIELNSNNIQSRI